MKIVKRVGLAVLGLVVCLVAGVTVYFYGLNPVVRPAPQLKAPSTPEAIARGQYLATGVAMCVECHSPCDSEVPGQPVHVGTEFTGRDFVEIKDFPGHIRTKNLTADVETGLGGYTDGEIFRAMMEGVGKDGHALFMMPAANLSKAMSDDDALAIIAYLRTLPAKHSEAKPIEIDFPLSMLVRAAPKAHQGSAPKLPDDPVERGKRLMLIGNCASCHSTHGKHHEDIDGMYLAGGDLFESSDGHKVYAPNLTSDPETGIGGFTDQQLRQALTLGLGHDARPLYFMPWTVFAQMVPQDIDAVIAALRTAPPIRHAVPKAQAATASAR
ncbi:MAG: c-type cytochrome [Myxococcaceae bacterium]